jgi:hypothetical protein
MHRGCHNAIKSVRRLAQPPLPVMDKLLKVRKCLKAPKMAAAIAAVKALPTICINFDQTPDFLSGFVSQNSPLLRHWSPIMVAEAVEVEAAEAIDEAEMNKAKEVAEALVEAMAVESKAAAEATVVKDKEEEEPQDHFLELSLADAILQRSTSPSCPRTCSNHLKFELLETRLEARVQLKQPKPQL